MKQGFNVIFLLNTQPPTKVVMLKRAPTKKFAPELYTGIGGKMEPDETIEQAAYRELVEEAGFTDIKLTEFARVITNNEVTLYYFWGIYDRLKLPDCPEGTLSWMALKDLELIEMEIIPTTRAMIAEWRKRKFQTNQPWTMHVTRPSDFDMITPAKVDHITNGLVL